MADRDDGRRRTVRAVFGLAVAGALGVGAWGLTLYVRPAPGLDVLHRDLDLAYNDLQLFVLSSDPLNGGPYPWQLDVARFLAPLATVYALAEAVLAVLGERMARRSLRRRRGHTIVVGDSAAAHAIARGLARTAGADVVTAADGEPETLRAHGIVGAAAIYACETEETHRGVNVATVLTAAALRRHGGLQAYAQVADADLALTLRARRLGLPSGDKARLDFFNVEEVAAGLVIGGTDLATVATPHILISGLGTFGRAVLVEYARHWRLRSPWREYRPLVTVVAADAATGVREVTAQWPFVGDVCRIHPVTGQLGPALMASLNPAPTTAYLCDDDEVRAIRTALGAAALWRGGPRSLVVRLDVMSRLGSAFHGGDAGTRDALLLDDLDGRLLLAGVTEMASDTVIAVQQDLVERLAQALHEQYLLTQLAVGQRVATKPALTLWPELNDDLKASNRTQAGDIGTKLRKINCTVAPRGEDDNAFGFTDDEVALLAEHEHDRWFAERHDTGWRYAEHRDDDAMLHPAMLPWAELPPRRSGTRTATPSTRCRSSWPTLDSGSSASPRPGPARCHPHAERTHLLPWRPWTSTTRSLTSGPTPSTRSTARPTPVPRPASPTPTSTCRPPTGPKLSTSPPSSGRSAPRSDHPATSPSRSPTPRSNNSPSGNTVAGAPNARPPAGPSAPSATTTPNTIPA